MTTSMRRLFCRGGDTCNRDSSDHYFPCFFDPAQRSTLYLKLAVVIFHLFFSGLLFLFDSHFCTSHPWYMSLYLVLFVATIAQYFFTSGSSPGYIHDALRIVNESNASATTSLASKQPASSKNGSISITMDQKELGKSLLGSKGTSWTKLVMDMYPPGSTCRYTSSEMMLALSLKSNTLMQASTCSYCNVLQPPRAKHCHDCDKCVIQFDHHCVWLGTCIGHGNHCRFWWYICEETTLCLWTCILYIACLKANILKTWWVDLIMIVLLATLLVLLIFLLLLLFFHRRILDDEAIMESVSVLPCPLFSTHAPSPDIPYAFFIYYYYLIMTNQTTFELVRRRRIPYLRGIPERVHPFSKGVRRNVYSFCCSRSSQYGLEQLPTAHELEEKSRPFTCLNIISCCC